MKQFLLLIVLLVTIISCGQPALDSVGDETISLSKIPQAIIFEKEISGMILGRSLKSPFALAKDFKNNIYLTDMENHRIIKFDSTMKPLHDIGGYGTQEGLLNRPTFITIDNGLNLVVSDEGNRRISRYDSQLSYFGEILFDDDEDPLKYGYPSGVAVTTYGETWVSDRENSRIVVFNNIGRFDHFLGEFGASGGQFDTPEKIFMTSDKQFIICDGGNGRIVFYDEFGNFHGESKEGYLEYPISITEQGNMLWVVDGVANSIVCLSSRGKLINIFSGRILGLDKPLNEPTDILFLSDEKLLITDTGNNRLLICRVIYEEIQK